MIDSPARNIVAAAMLSLLASTPTTAQEDEAPAWVVSCSQNSRLVFRQTMQESEAYARQSDIVRRYPDATCVFVSTASSAPDVFSAPIGTEQHSDEALNAALRAILGEETPDFAAAPAATPTPVPATAPTADAPALPDIVTPPDHRPTIPGFVRLSVYKTTDIEDALSDWRRILARHPGLAAYTPSTITTDDGYVVLSAGPVAGREMKAFCLVVQASGMECMADLEDVRPEDLGHPFLSHFFPEVFPETAHCERRLTLDSDNSCWRSGLLAPTAFPPFPRISGNAVGMVAEVPLPRPRPER